MKTLKSGFTRLGRSELASKARHIATTLGSAPGSTYFPEPFPSPVPSLADLWDATAALEAANTEETSVSVTQLRRALRIPLQEILRGLAGYVQLVAAGNVEMLCASGFEIAREPVHSHQPPGKPHRVRARATGVDGGIAVSCQAEPRADAYELEVSTVSGTGPWTAAGSFTSSRHIHAGGFAHGEDVYVHLRAIGTNGLGPWSDPAVALVS